MTLIIRLGRTWQNFFLRLFNSSSITTGARRRMSMSMFMGPMPPARNKLTYRPCPSATCCVNVAKREHQKCCTKNMTVSNLIQQSSNMLQHIATGWPNVRNMLCPTMLQDVESVWPAHNYLFSSKTPSTERHAKSAIAKNAFFLKKYLKLGGKQYIILKLRK